MTFEAVFLARHGQTEWNQQHRWQGQLDSPLTEAGTRHAQALARLAPDLQIDSVISSPLGRARATAQISADVLGLGIEVIVELAEMDHGDMAGLTAAEAEARHPGVLDKRPLDKYRWRFPAGESYADVDQRAAAALERAALLGCRRPLIVSHEMIGRMLLRNLTAADPQDVLGTRQPHDIVYSVNPRTGQVLEHTTTPASRASIV